MKEKEIPQTHQKAICHDGSPIGFEEPKQVYQRNLPHIHIPGSDLFVTFRLAGSIPKNVLEALEAEHRQKEAMVLNLYKGLKARQMLKHLRKSYFFEYDGLLDNPPGDSPQYLKEAEIGSIVMDALKYWDGKCYDLLSCCLMPNHVHVYFADIRGRKPFYRAMQSIKSFSAKKANKILCRQGAFWQKEYYDRYIRNERQARYVLDYIANNPVKAGLCENPQDWPFFYEKP